MFGLFGGGDKKSDSKKNKEVDKKENETTKEQQVPNREVGNTKGEDQVESKSIKNATTVSAPSTNSSSNEPNKNDNTTASDNVSGNVLMISNQRHRAFYERAARELLASGYEVVELSALGNAVPLGTQVALSLQDKKAATLVKIETKYVHFTSDSGRRRNMGPLRSSGLTIVLRRHPEFKGTRIVPGHVFFCPKSNHPRPYPESPDLVIVSVNAGLSDNLFNTPYGETFKTVLQNAGQNVLTHKELYKHLFVEALKANQGITDIKSMKFVGELAAIKTYNPDLKAAFVRIPPGAKENDMTGSVFVQIFEEEKCPDKNENNLALAHVIPPKGNTYPSSESFLDAVQITAITLASQALCDFNGYSRRHSGPPRLRKLSVARMGLFSVEPELIHSKATKQQVAKAILKGLNIGYHFGTSPRVQFVYEPEELMKKAWIEESGADELSLQSTDEKFRRS